MSTVPSTPRSPEQQDASTAVPAQAASGLTLDALRPPSHLSRPAIADPLAEPGELAARDDPLNRRLAARQRLTLILAGSTLQAALLTAALAHPSNGLSLDDEALNCYLVRAAQWIADTTQALARLWRAPDGEGRDPEASLSDFQRYQLARALAGSLRDQPELVERIEPARMAAYLASDQKTSLPAERYAEWRSAGVEADLQLAYSRALGRVLEAALQCDFNRDIPTVLRDAETLIRELVQQQTDPLSEALALPPEARQIATLHYLDLDGPLYAATLRRVHRDSVALIQRYQECLNAGDSEGAEHLAEEYQARRLGYAGIAHHLRVVCESLGQFARAAVAADQTPPMARSPAPPSHPKPALQVGSLVIARRATAICARAERGVCYEEYRIDGRPGWSFIFESGRYDGFSPDEVEIMLEVTGEVCPAVADYAFTNVTRLAADFRRGRFAAAFPPASTRQTPRRQVSADGRGGP